MYRNIVFDSRKSIINLFTWNSEGERCMETYNFRPFLYVKHPDGKDGTSIYGEKLKKIEFDDKKSREDFAEKMEKCYYNITPEQQFLIDRYASLNKSPNFSSNPLKIFYLDIEVYSPNEFPNPHKAEQPINLITVYDTLSNVYQTFGTKQYYGTNENSNFIYNYYETEFEMLRGFVRFWRKDFPDIVTGWNCNGFDIPYIMNRINRLYKLNEMYEDTEAYHRLSPLDYSFAVENVERRLENYEFLWYIKGITIFDYMYLYKVFTRDKRESYSLNNIANVELGSSKLNHDAVSLSELSETNWDEFVNYNVQDVKLVVELEKKLRYMEICRKIAYLGLSPFSSAEGTVAVVSGIIAQKALEEGKIIPTFTKKDIRRFEGGYVKEPKTGLQESILYFDANSLYPNTIVTLNISPETKLGTITKDKDNMVHITTKNDKVIKLDYEKFKEFTKKEEISISESNTIFTQKKKGLVPAIIEEIYSERVATKKQSKEYEHKRIKLATSLSKVSPEKKEDINNALIRLDIKINQADVYQYTLKILLNRIYGYFAEKSSPFYDIDMASSVTMTGQSCIKEASRLVTNYLINEHKLPDDDYIVANDTDSAMISIHKLLQSKNIPIEVDNKVNPEVYNIAKDIKNVIDTGINTWATQHLNSKWPKYEFKLENISSAGLFLKKKHYILEMICDEDGKPFYTDKGIQLKRKYKYTGVEIVRTSTPKKVKPLLKNIVEMILSLRDKNKVSTELQKIYDNYCKFDLYDIAVASSLNNYEKYESLSSAFKIGKHTPIHVKSAIYYNRLLEKHNITNKYQKLKSGDKLKFFLLQDNNLNLKTVAFLNSYPEEFNYLVPDKIKMFEKTVLKPLERIFSCLKWNIRPPTSEEKNDLLQMFQ